MFHPLTARERAWRPTASLLGLFLVLAVVSAVGAFEDRDWWIAVAFLATIIGVTVPLLLLQVRREVVGKSLDVGRDTVTLERRSRDPVVIRRDDPSFAVAFGRVKLAPAISAYERVMVITDGRQAIWLNDVPWGIDTLRKIAAALDVPELHTSVTTGEFRRSVGLPTNWFER